MDPLDAAVDLVRRAEPVQGVTLIGVDGPSGAGKSTFARALAARLDAPLVETDDFIVWNDYDSWWARFEEQVLLPLAEGRDAVYQVRDWVGDEFGRGLAGWKTLPWSGVVVVEGVTTTRRAAAERYAVRIWVDAPEEVRLARGVQRDGEDHRHLWLEALVLEAERFRRDPVRDRAHLRVDGGR